MFKTLANLHRIVILTYVGLQPMVFSFQKKLVKYIWNNSLLIIKLSQLLEVNFLSSNGVETSHVIANRMV